ncbi:MAG: translation initiation factor IF-3 [Oscillospiraceae bacterium]|nr:translation initiation factor IF-3 [Oscillospiraceae bacterium]MBR6096723.1 translation initiation factor IF-3 [Oscillospiraceae bacterium]MBR7055891.1 translation initiation factor IF-3 [Oscillospiraceae bacterium]
MASVLTRPQLCAPRSTLCRTCPAAGSCCLRGCHVRLRFLFGWRCSHIANQDYLVNEEINVPEIRLIGDNGEQLGIMPPAEAMKIAESKEKDLVMIAAGGKPPVCKIMDYGKYRFEQSKREKEAKKKQRVIEIKEIRMSPSIGDNDFNTKLRAGQKFLAEGNRLKVTIRFRGREMAHTHLGEQLLRDYAAKCTDLASMDKNPKLEGRNMSMFLSPKQK